VEIGHLDSTNIEYRSHMNTDDLKKEVHDILEIVKLCPKELQEKCFELLLTDVLARNRQTPARTFPNFETPRTSKPVTGAAAAEALPADVDKRMRLFATQYGLTVADILKIYHVDELGNVSIEATDLKSAKTSKRQRRLALLLGGKYQFQGGSFDVPTEELRELCVTYGAYDAANFIANLKNSREILAGFKPDANNKLSPKGKAELGALLKEIGS
jgi:hypothetical protein